MLFVLSNHVIDIHNVVFCKLPIEIKCGKKKFVLECETLLNKAMQSYATKLVQGNVGLESQPRGEPGTSRILECHRFPV